MKSHLLSINSTNLFVSIIVFSIFFGLYYSINLAYSKKEQQLSVMESGLLAQEQLINKRLETKINNFKFKDLMTRQLQDIRLRRLQVLQKQKALLNKKAKKTRMLIIATLFFHIVFTLAYNRYLKGNFR